MQITGRDRGIQFTRAFALMLVVVGHATAAIAEHWAHYPVPLRSTLLSILYRVIYLFHMQLFFMISGFLWDSSKYQNIVKLIVNKSKRLLVPLAAVLLVYLIPIRYFTGWYLGTADSLWEAYVNVFRNPLADLGHLWFLETLFFVFMLSYVLEKTIQKKKYHFDMFHNSLCC